MRFIMEQLEKMKNPVQSDETVFYAGEVSGISQYDLKYVYHHLQPGTPVRLHPGNNGGIEVMYRGLKLGYVPGMAAHNLKKVIKRGFELKCRVTRVQKKKFLPIEILTIKITD